MHLLTATCKDLHIEKQQKLQKVILFSSTLTHSQCDAKNIQKSDTIIKHRPCCRQSQSRQSPIAAKKAFSKIRGRFSTFLAEKFSE